MKPKSITGLLTGISVCLCIGTAHAADLTWDNGAATGAWNTTDANWTGSTWSNSNPDNAFFNSVGGTVSLDSGITAGSVSVGTTSGNFANLTLSGGSLSASSFTVQGDGNNSGAYGSNPTLTVNSSVSISGDAAIGRANLDITGGTFTANRIISSAGSADWGRLVISGGTVTATNGVDGSVGTGATFAIDLNGGTLYTPFIKVADREEGTNNSAWLTFNGGTVVATASTETFITTYGGGNNVYISNGGAIIDTDGYNIEIGKLLRDSAGQSGSLTKNGAGTLTLSGSTGGLGGSYSGATTINSGVLAMKSGTAWILQGGSAVTVNSGATLQGNDSLANQLNGLELNSGTVTATGAGNADWGNFYLTGNVTATGTSNINADIALRATNVDFSVASGGTLNVGGSMHNGANFGIYSGDAATVSKSGDGTMVVSGTHTYSGATTVSAGTLYVTGALTNSAVTVEANGTIGSNGAAGGLGNGLTIEAGGNLDLTGATIAFNSTGILSLTGGSLTLGNLTFEDIVGWDWANADLGTYELIDGTFTINWGSTAYISPETAYDFGNGKKGYFTTGSLQVVVIPEPRAALLGSLGMLMLLRRRRR